MSSILNSKIPQFREMRNKSRQEDPALFWMTHLVGRTVGVDAFFHGDSLKRGKISCGYWNDKQIRWRSHTGFQFLHEPPLKGIFCYSSTSFRISSVRSPDCHLCLCAPKLLARGYWLSSPSGIFVLAPPWRIPFEVCQPKFIECFVISRWSGDVIWRTGKKN